MSYEIELKAHVYDKKNTTEILNKNCTYLGKTEKSDTYYTFNNNSKSCRIRKETSVNGSSSKMSIIFTYKRKEQQQNSDGTIIEVNDENECEISDEKALEVFFEDCGAKITLKKQKSVEHWNFTKGNYTAHIELCNVPPLGDFLEIEVINDSNSNKAVDEAKQLILSIFEMCGIPQSAIENRYYKDMLKNL